MINQELSLSELSRQIVWIDIYIDFELFCDRVLDVFAQLFVVCKEGNLVRLRAVGTSSCDFLHKHENLIDASDVLLDLS